MGIKRGYGTLEKENVQYKGEYTLEKNFAVEREFPLENRISTRKIGFLIETLHILEKVIVLEYFQKVISTRRILLGNTLN